MRLVCVTQHWWNKYVEICEHRKTLVPWFSKSGLFVAEGDELVAGVLIYDTAGPFTFFEYLVTNETATPRQRLKAVKMMAEQVVPYCRTVGKYPMIMVRHKGITGILKRIGMVSAQASGMTYPMENLV